MKHYVLLSAIITLGAGTAASAQAIVCNATSAAINGLFSRKASGGISFTLSVTGRTVKKASLHWIEGIISFSRFNDDDAEKFAFKLPVLRNNPKYRPIKYFNSWQFKDFVSENGKFLEPIFGDFVLDKTEVDGKRKARLIMQVGDHHGGTIKFDCRRKS